MSHIDFVEVITIHFVLDLNFFYAFGNSHRKQTVSLFTQQYLS